LSRSVNNIPQHNMLGSYEYLSFVGTAGFFTFCFWVGTLKRPLEASDAFFLYRAYCAFLICSPRYTEYE
jgi:hypothetical protein